MNANVNYRRARNSYALPDPPDNLDFLDLPEAEQDRIADKFESGVKRTYKRADGARARAWGAWMGFVRRCQANRRAEQDTLASIRRKQR